MGQSLHKAKIEIETRQAVDAVHNLSNEVQQTTQHADKLSDELTDAASKAKQGADEATRSTKDLDETIRKTQETGERAARGVGEALRTIELTSIIQQVQMVGSALGELAQPAVTFEQSMADLQAITGYAGEELEELTETARRVGKESGLGAAESARAFSILAGQIDVPLEALKDLQQQTITLAQAGALPLEEAANAVAGTLNQFGLEADQAGRVVNVLAAGSRAGGAEVIDLAESFKVAGAAANAAGVSVEETAGVLEILAQNNTKGAEAGTAMRNVLIAMQTRLGIDVSKTGFVGGLKVIQEELNSMSSDVERTTFLAKTFGRENIVAAQFLLDNADAVGEMTAAVTDSNAALEQAELRNDTWAHKIELAKAKIDDVMLSMTDFTGAILPVAGIVGEQVSRFAGLLPVVSAAMRGIRGLGVQTMIATAKQVGLNAALAANPIGVVVMAVTALVAAVVYAYKHFDGFRASVDNLWAKLKELWSMLYERLKPVLDLLGKVIGGVLKVVIGAFALQLQGVADVLGWVASKVIDLINWLDKFLVPLRQAIAGLKELLGLQSQVAATPHTTQPQADKVDHQELGNQSVRSDSPLGRLAQLVPGAAKAIGNKLIAQTESVAPPRTHTASTASSGGADPDKDKIYNLTTIEGLQNNISKLQERLKRATVDEAVELQRQINKYKELLDTLQATINARAKAPKIEQIAASKPALSTEGISDPKSKIADIASKAGETLRDKTAESLAKAREEWDKYVAGLQDKMGSISNIMGNMGNVIGGAAGSWLQWGAGVVQAIGQVLPKLIALFTAESAVMAAEGGKSVAGIPIVGPAMAVAAVTSILAALANVPKPTAFAAGGVVSGPTYALVGEYAGAENNPEVIAPLDKLRSYLRQDAQAAGGGEVQFRIEGRTLVGILSKEHKHSRLS